MKPRYDFIPIEAEVRQYRYKSIQIRGTRNGRTATLWVPRQAISPYSAVHLQARTKGLALTLEVQRWKLIEAGLVDPTELPDEQRRRKVLRGVARSTQTELQFGSAPKRRPTEIDINHAINEADGYFVAMAKDAVAAAHAACLAAVKGIPEAEARIRALADEE